MSLVTHVVLWIIIQYLNINLHNFKTTYFCVSDEERRLNIFRRECLSKAIQWNIVDLINAAMEKADDSWYPKWLSREEAKLVKKETDKKNQFRRFLCVLRKKEFVVMQEWLHVCGLDETVIKQVWNIFEEFSDKDTNRSKLKCFRCRLIQGVNVQSMADYLFSADILKSEEEYLRISSTERPVGAQDDLWKCVLRDCEKYICPEIVALALKVALMELLDSAEDTMKKVYESLLSDIDTCKPQELLSCSCDRRCSQSFHPPSCLETLSLSGVYFTPLTRRKREKSSSSSEAPQSSSSSNDSLDRAGEVRGCDRDEILSPDDDTDLKKTHGTASDNKKPDGSGDVSKFTFRTQRSRSRSLRRKRSQTKVQSDSSTENISGENNNARQIHYSYKSNTNKLNENKPCMIPVKANTVYIETGTKYISVLRKARSSESSVEV